MKSLLLLECYQIFIGLHDGLAMNTSCYPIGPNNDTPALTHVITVHQNRWPVVDSTKYFFIHNSSVTYNGITRWNAIKQVFSRFRIYIGNINTPTTCVIAISCWYTDGITGTLKRIKVIWCVTFSFQKSFESDTDELRQKTANVIIRHPTLSKVTHDSH